MKSGFLSFFGRNGLSICLLSRLLFVLPLFSLAQINTQIDTAHIKIGEPIHYTLNVHTKTTAEVVLPIVKDTLSIYVEVLKNEIDTVQEGSELRLTQRLTLTSYEPGEYLIRSLPIIIGKDTLLSHSFHIQVDDVEIDSTNLTGFPIKPIMEESYSWKDYLRKYWLEAVLILLMAAVLLAVWWWMKNFKGKKTIKENLKTPYQEAKNALKKLDEKEYVRKGQIKPYYSELSFIVRRYLGRTYRFSSMELLSDDLVDYMNKLNPLSSEDLNNMKEFLFDSDLVKYAKAIPEEQRHTFYRKWAENLIEKTKPVQTADETQNNNQKIEEK